MVEYDSGYTAGMVYVKYPSGVRGEIQIVGEKVLDIANAEHIPYDAFLGKPYAGAFPKENLGKASEILDPIRTAATSLDEVQKAKYLGYLNSQYTRARQIEQGASPAAVNLPEGISGKLSVDNLIKANGALNELKTAGNPSKMSSSTSGFIGKVDESFVALSQQEKLSVAFKRIEHSFGKNYADKTRALYDSVRHATFESDTDLGSFSATGKKPLIQLNENIGNADVLALTTLHEVRHLRQFNKVMKGTNYNQAKVRWGTELNNKQKEVFATSTNVWQGKRLGLNEADLLMFKNYYDFYRR